MTPFNIDIMKGQNWDSFMEKTGELFPTEEHLRKALSSTNKRMSDWIRTRAVRALAPALGFPRKILRHRFRSFRIFSTIQGGKVWFGLDGVPFIDLDPEPSGKGTRTRIGNYYEEGAFLQKNRRTGRMMVLKRRGKTWKAPGIRGPTDPVRVDIHDRVLRWIETCLNHPEFEREFYKRLEHELAWRTTLSTLTS